MTAECETLRECPFSLQGIYRELRSSPPPPPPRSFHAQLDWPMHSDDIYDGADNGDLVLPLFDRAN